MWELISWQSSADWVGAWVLVFGRGHVTVPKGKTVTFNCIGYPTMVYGDTAGSTGSTSKSATVQIYADSFIAYGCVFKVNKPKSSFLESMCRHALPKTFLEFLTCQFFDKP